MVLQRNTTVALWGWADPGEKIMIRASWLEETFNLKADPEGNWSLEVQTTDSREPQTLSIKDAGSGILLENILLGEVWLCSGQSNMGMPIQGLPGQPVFGASMAIARAENPNLRLFNIPQVGSITPEKDLDRNSGWQQATPENVREFSAVAYFFAKQLQEILNVPVGMIHPRGGSRVECWISKEALSPYQEVNLEDMDLSRGLNTTPTYLYNATIHPLIPYTIRGALWYQGEANRREPEEYKQLLPLMVEDWRTRWGIGDFPFYFVQIAPYGYRDPDAFESEDNSAFIRESQLMCADIIPNSGIAITLDIGEELFIHPPRKKEVADRLLFLALNGTYGLESVDGRSPVFESMEIKDGVATLSFRNAETGIYAKGDLSGFEIAGEDRVFYPAEAEIVGRRRLRVKSERVPSPIAIRYGWSNWVRGTLFDTNLLPASSFRTDDWEDASRYRE
jgi:sialate O-acetylesterase